MAAASLNAAMPELIERFEAAEGSAVELVLASTGSLAAQIENGAPADLFFSADEETVERLSASGEIRSATVETYATGRLVLTWRSDLKRPDSLAAIGEAAYATIAIANPEHAPYGAAARQVIERVGMWEPLQERMVLGENVAQAYQFVRTGNADLAIVARSVLAPAATEYMAIDSALHLPIRQSAGILERSAHPAASEFLEFVMDREGQAILVENGFGPAPG